MMMTAMNDDHDFNALVAATLERLQIEPKDLFGYVYWLRQRYAECVEALRDIREFSTDSQAAELANDVLIQVGADSEPAGEQDVERVEA